MINFIAKEQYTFDDLLKIMQRLRAPDGCPWDREQTHQSIRRNLIEEAYEACEAIDTGDGALLKEELGDVLLQVVFHAAMEEENGAFDITDVIDGICRKLIVRHPHIFAGHALQTGTAGEVLDNWEAIKNETKQQSGGDTLYAVARSLPALIRAEKVRKRAASAGMSGAAYDGQALEHALSALLQQYGGNPAARAEVIGRVLMQTVQTAREWGVEAEEALSQETDRFIHRCTAGTDTPDT